MEVALGRFTEAHERMRRIAKEIGKESIVQAEIKAVLGILRKEPVRLPERMVFFTGHPSASAVARPTGESREASYEYGFNCR